MRATTSLLLASALLASCAGTTGGEVIAFDAAAAGAEDARAGGTLQFVTDLGWNVSLTSAKLHIGAVYLNRSMPISGVQNTSCILPDTYVGQITTGLDVDLLSPQRQPFPLRGEGVTAPAAVVAQVWLTGAPIDQADDDTPILQVEGTAERNGASKPFTGTITIGSNRLQNGIDATQAGAAPICKQRIVSPIPVLLALRETGSLLLRVDPRFLFVNVDFSALPAVGDAFAFTDDVTQKDQPSLNLYNNLRAASRLYTFEWVP
ncbi:MAG TPA: hypothetical protein VK550_36120 [Polyangiaceae bacterium]|nr:hypothetical protein [Polyangiaceae bacterium]